MPTGVNGSSSRCVFVCVRDRYREIGRTWHNVFLVDRLHAYISNIIATNQQRCPSIGVQGYWFTTLPTEFCGFRTDPTRSHFLDVHLLCGNVLAFSQQITTRSSAVAKRPRDASCLYSFYTLEWYGYPMVKKIIEHVYSFWHDPRTWRTHGHRVTAYTALMHMHRAVKMISPCSYWKGFVHAADAD